MFGKKPNELQLEIANHKEKIERGDRYRPQPRQPKNLEALGFSHITEEQRTLFEMSAHYGDFLNFCLETTPWSVEEDDKQITSYWNVSGTGRHFHLYYNDLKAGALVLTTAVGVKPTMSNVLKETEGVAISLGFKFPFLYPFDPIYHLLRLIVGHIGDKTDEDFYRRLTEVNNALLRTLWGASRDEAYWFSFYDEGPAVHLAKVVFNGGWTKRTSV